MYGKRIVVIIVVVVLLGAGYYGYTQYIAQEPEVAPPETVEEGIPDVVSATGVVMPARWANLSFQTGGRVEEISVEAGDEVKEGQLLARLDATALERQVAQAQAGLATARARLAQVRAGVRPEEIEAAEAGLAAAQAGLKQAQGTLASAQANLDKLLEEPTKARLAAAEAALKAAEDSYQRVLARPEPEDIRQAKLNLDQAKNSLWSAQAQRDSTCGAVSRGAASGAQCDSAEAQVLNAEVSVQLAEIAYQQAQEPATAAEIENAAAQVQQARDEWEQLRDSPTAAELAAAKAQVIEAESQLEMLVAGPTGEDLAIAEAEVEQARLSLAQAKLNLEAEQLDIETWDTTQAELSLTQARLSLEAAQRGLEETALVAPVDGTVTALNIQPAEMASANQTAVVVSDLAVLEVDVNLDETEVAQISVGQEALVSVDAFPDVELTGEVMYIAPVAETQSGVVLYPVTIRLAPTEIPVRAGMTADVEIVSASQENALIVPLRAVHTEGERAYVYRLVGGQTEQVAVELGMMTETEVEITSGLAEELALSLVEGDVVSVVAAPTQGSTGRGFGPGGMFGGRD
jgi:HlyD family secretion protein